MIGVNLGVDRNTVATVALGGEILSRRERPHQRGEHDVLHVVESLSQMISDVLQEHPEKSCLGVGVAAFRAPSALAMGSSKFAPNLGWVEVPFAELLSEKLGLKVVCDNDANLGARAEHLRGVAVGFDDIAYLSGSVGLGGGFIVGGLPLAGAGGYAGEVGHLMVDPRVRSVAAAMLAAGRRRWGRISCWSAQVGCRVEDPKRSKR